MPKKKNRIKFDAFKQMRRDAAGVELEADDGTVFVIDPPDLWPDSLNEVKTDDEYVRAIMGDQADAFIAAGGTARIINSLVIQRNHLSAPESSASSES